MTEASEEVTTCLDLKKKEEVPRVWLGKQPLRMKPRRLHSKGLEQREAPAGGSDMSQK